MFRADKCYGGKKTSFTPNLDYLIEKGTYFEQAISSSDKTTTAIGSIYTGLYSIKTGIYGNIGFINENTTDYLQNLKEHGYSIYMTVPDLHFYRKKFSEYAGTNFISFSPSGNLSLLHNGVGNMILNTLDKKMDKPWFYHIHLMDLHMYPIVPKPDFDNEKFGSTHYDRMVSQMDVWLGKILQKIKLDETLIILIGDHGHYPRTVSKGTKIRVSDKRVSESTTQTEILAKKIKSITPKFLQKIGRKFLIKLIQEIQFTKVKFEIRSLTLSPYQKRILTAVHGGVENLLYDDLVRVPLIFCGYGVPEGKVISAQVGTIDIFPTILELIKIENIAEKEDGMSLMSFFSGKEINERPIFLQSGSMYVPEKEYLLGARTSNYKFFLQKKNSKLTRILFDLKKDPYELTNVVETNPKVANEMENFIKSIKKDAQPDNSDQISKEEEEKITEELKKLGYI